MWGAPAPIVSSGKMRRLAAEMMLRVRRLSFVDAMVSFNTFIWSEVGIEDLEHFLPDR